MILLSLFLAVLTGCSRYADFALPPPEGRQTPVRPRWEVRPQPLLARGTGWDSVDTLNPSVVEKDGLLWNLYSGYDGKTWHTGIATSSDGVAWTRLGRILSPDPATWEGGYIAANGATLVRDGRFLHWYQAGDPSRIGLATSADGRAWAKHPAPVLPVGPRGSWDERGVADPYVIEADGQMFLFFLGQDRARRQRLGIARSRDGIHWEKLRRNPILELGPPGSFDENGLGEPAVWTSHGRWWMLYTGRDRVENRRLGLAWSRDGVQWRRYSDQAILAGGEPWNSRVVCDPSVIRKNASVWVWFGGGDVAHPAENIHGQIGFAQLFLEVAP